jgi:uncharacterized protein (TIGR02284 family)
MPATKDLVDSLNSLLRGEIAATETYNQALENLQGDADQDELRRFRDDHRETANAWRQHIHQFGGDPDQDSGGWGMLAKAAEGTAKQFGKTAALRVLLEGEKRGLHDYETILEHNDLPRECQALIRTCLPQTQDHIRRLEAMLAK